MKPTKTQGEVTTTKRVLTMQPDLEALLLLERGLIALGDFPEVRHLLAQIRALLPAQEFVDTALEIMTPSSLTTKIERRLRKYGLDVTVWCQGASNDAYVYQAINGGNTTLALDKLSALLSADPELGPITCTRSGPQGQHLTLRLAVNGGGA